MDTIALFGATGRTGRRVLERALGAGYVVSALARDPSKLPLDDPRLTVIVGDVLDPRAVERTVAGSDAVLSLVGHVKGSPPTLQTDATRSIVTAMEQLGICRLVTLSGGGLRAPEDRPRAADRVMRWVLRVVAGRVLKDAEGHLAVLQGSGLDWTVVRAPRLTERPGRGAASVGWVGATGRMEVSRDDVADVLLEQLRDPAFVRRMPFVT